MTFPEAVDARRSLLHVRDHLAHLRFALATAPMDADRRMENLARAEQIHIDVEAALTDVEQEVARHCRAPNARLRSRARS